MKVDILIIGAGPAGLSAAMSAAKGGEARVLVVEKEGKLGVKPCAEAVSAATLEDMGAPKDRRIIRNPIRGARIHAPDERIYVEITGELGQGYIINKKSLLEWMARRASSLGATIWVASPAIDLHVNSKGFVDEVAVLRHGRLVKINPKIVIACDGIASLVARKLFERRGYRVIPTAQYIMADVGVGDEHIIYVWLGRDVAPGGYLWLFPRGEKEICVGVGVQRGVPRDYLERFIERKQEIFSRAVELEYSISAVPIGGQVKQRVRGNVMLCGDAAGQVIPLTGGGIHSSSIAGFIAGKVAKEAVAYNEIHEDKLREYEREYDLEWGARIRRSLKALKVIERLSDEDLNELAKVLDPEDIIALANGLDVRKVAQKLMKHPSFALKIAKALIGA